MNHLDKYILVFLFIVIVVCISILLLSPLSILFKIIVGIITLFWFIIFVMVLIGSYKDAHRDKNYYE